MNKSKAIAFVGVVIATVALSHAQTEAPRNLAGAEFPCTYTKPSAPYEMTVKFLETINGETFATGFQVRSDNVTIRSENAVCRAGGECELTGNVTLTLTPQKVQIK
jgi:hypothetical protein